MSLCWCYLLGWQNKKCADRFQNKGVWGGEKKKNNNQKTKPPKSHIWNLKSDFTLYFVYLLLKQLCSESYEERHLFYGNNTKKNVEFLSSNLILVMRYYSSDDAQNVPSSNCLSISLLLKEFQFLNLEVSIFSPWKSLRFGELNYLYVSKVKWVGSRPLISISGWKSPR